jgi:hypothetical protein
MAAIYTDIGAFIGAANAVLAEVITSGAGNDGVVVDGPDIDRNAFSDRGMSASFLIGVVSVLDDGETCIIESQIQDSDDGITYADYDGSIAGAGTHPTTTLTGGTGGSTETVCHKHDIDLRTARRYIHIQTELTLSRGATDTAAYGGVVVIGGQQELPGTGVEAST